MRDHGLNEQRRRNALVALLAVSVPAALFFGFLNLRIDAVWLALMNLALAVMSAGFLLTIRRRHVAAQPLVAVYLLTLLATLVLALARPDLHPNAHSWMAVFPVLCYLLLEPRRAFWLTACALWVSAISYVLSAEIAPRRFDLMGLAHVITPVVGLFVVCHYYSRSQANFETEMQRRIATDPLTGLWNREKLIREFEREQQRSQRTGMPLSVILIDLDHFKNLNDNHGHEAGDAALVFVSRLFEQRSRESDLLCRIGGEEFLILLPDTPASGAVTDAEDLRSSLEQSDFQYGSERIRMTLSAGVAELGRDGFSWPELYRSADSRLYACKKAGRNRVSGSDSERAAAGTG